MRGPPDHSSERAPLPGRPNRRADFWKPDESSLAAFDLQAEKLRRLYSFCRATAYTIAALAFAGGPR